MSNNIAVGRFGSPYGIKGWIKVISYTHPIDKILEYLPWQIQKQDTNLIIDKIKGKVHGANLVVSLGDCHDRDIAKTYTNIEIFIDRSQLPEPSAEEYYWIDLIGLSVTNCEQQYLGQIDQVFATGSNDVLIVKEQDTGKERYIPYLKQVILEVDLANKVMTVDWDATF